MSTAWNDIWSKDQNKYWDCIENESGKNETVSCSGANSATEQRVALQANRQCHQVCPAVSSGRASSTALIHEVLVSTSLYDIMSRANVEEQVSESGHKDREHFSDIAARTRSQVLYASLGPPPLRRTCLAACNAVAATGILLRGRFQLRL